MAGGRFNVNEYVPVQERINLFWQEHPNGSIKTKLEDKVLDPQGGILEVVFSAIADTGVDPGTEVRAICTGWGSESRADFPAAFIEKAETKAIGRALSNLGYAKSSEDRPSREEMDSAHRRQSASSPPPQRQQSSTAPAPSKSSNGRNQESDEEKSEFLGLRLSMEKQREIWNDGILAANEATGEDSVAGWRRLASYARWAYGQDKLQLWRFVELLLSAPTEQILKGIFDLTRQEGITAESVVIAVDKRSGELRDAAQPANNA